MDNDGFLTIIGSLSAVANGGTRTFWAGALDRFSFKKVYTVLLIT